MKKTFTAFAVVTSVLALAACSSTDAGSEASAPTAELGTAQTVKGADWEAEVTVADLTNREMDYYGEIKPEHQYRAAVTVKSVSGDTPLPSNAFTGTVADGSSLTMSIGGESDEIKSGDVPAGQERAGMVTWTGQPGLQVTQIAFVPDGLLPAATWTTSSVPESVAPSRMPNHDEVVATQTPTASTAPAVAPTAEAPAVTQAPVATAVQQVAPTYEAPATKAPVVFTGAPNGAPAPLTARLSTIALVRRCISPAGLCSLTARRGGPSGAPTADSCAVGAVGRRCRASRGLDQSFRVFSSPYPGALRDDAWVEEKRQSEDLKYLVTSMREVAHTWYRYGHLADPPYRPRSTAWHDATRERRLSISGTKSMTNLVSSCAMSMLHAADQILGIAACTEADGVGWAMYPPARTVLVATSRAHYLLSGDDAVERLRRILNQELAGWWSTRQMALPENEVLRTECEKAQLRIKSDGLHAGLIWKEAKNGPSFFKATTDQPNQEASPSETALTKLLMSQIPGMNEQMKALSYRLLSEVVHDRPRRAGFNTITAVRTITRDLQENTLTTSTPLIANRTAMVARAFEITGSMLIQHCGGDPEPFEQGVSRAIAGWLQLARAHDRRRLRHPVKPGP